MITVQVEKWADIVDELKTLIYGHWLELALNKDKVPLDPQWEEYSRRDEAGHLSVQTLRRDGKLVGYFLGFIVPGLHYKTCLTYTMDIFYVHPDARGHHGGKMLINCLETELKRRGVNRAFLGSKCHKDASWLFEHFGYEKVEVYYSKWIGG
jgi:GNAT superfamily N-acetyltransferase